MYNVQRQQASSSTILLAVGALCIFAGMFIFGNRLGFAEIFLGAHSVFGLPFTNGDSLKVLFIGFASALVVIQGIGLVVAGLVVRSKSADKSASPESAPASTHP